MPDVDGFPIVDDINHIMVPAVCAEGVGTVTLGGERAASSGSGADWGLSMGIRNPGVSTEDDRESLNRQSLSRLGAMVATAVALAAMASAGTHLAAFSGLTLISASVIATFALVFRASPNADHFTRWDEAAVMLALSLLSGLFVDPAAIDAIIGHGEGTAFAGGYG